jgi:hypothetical protein
MPFCPQCRTEYVESVTECADCATLLVDELPPLPPPVDVHWVALPPLRNEVEGGLLVEVLEGAGIRAMLKKDVFVSAFGSQGTMVFVPAERYADAERLREDTVGL